VPELEVWERPPSMLRNVDGGPSGGATARGSEVGDVDGGPPRGCCQHVRQQPPLKLEMSMAGPLRVLVEGPAVVTTEVEDVDGGPPGGCYWHVLQRPPPKLEMSIAAPLEGAVGMSGSDHHRSWRRRWQAPWGVLLVARSGSCHHRS
jgi:hypothetical protein